MKGVVLAGGTGSRLGELTRVTNKHLLPVGDVPMVYHPIRALRQSGVSDIMLVTGPEHVGAFAALLGDGSRLKCRLTYRVQERPGGTAQALALAEAMADGDYVFVMLGDNVFSGSPFAGIIWPDVDPSHAHAYAVTANCGGRDRYGVPVIRDGDLVGIDEKPGWAKAGYGPVVTGAYRYPPDVFDVIRRLPPVEPGGELGITSVNNWYCNKKRLTLIESRESWTDAGTLAGYRDANQMVRPA